MKQKQKLPPAAGFERNAFYERVLELRRTNPKAFDALAPVTKIALGREARGRTITGAPR